MRNKIVVGSRGSKLAMVQANLIVNQLKTTLPDVDVVVRPVVTGGDRNRNVPLEDMAGIGFFVKELEEALLEGYIDLAVHSLKDVPTEIPSDFHLVAITERLDPRDVLISRGEKLSELAAGSTIGTGSLRRSVQLKKFRQDVIVSSIRGNVDTRIHKVASGKYDGVILAAAALHRLGWEEKITEYLSTEYFLPCVGQGALAIEACAEDEELAGMLAFLNHEPTRQSVTAERTFLLALGGGCRAPIAALGTVNGTQLHLDGMVAETKHQLVLRSSDTGNSKEPEKLGIHLAKKLLDMGAKELLAEVESL
ncbi:hydroxymethylbilane synthase [Chloroflexota bacterium]